MHVERLSVLQEYHQTIADPYVKSALNFAIEDTQEAIAQGASRLRQLDQISTTRLADSARQKLLQQARSRRSLGDKIIFVWRGLQYQFDWYHKQMNKLIDDSDTQAVFVAMAEQARIRLERWETLMDEMKVPRRDSV